MWDLILCYHSVLGWNPNFSDVKMLRKQHDVRMRKFGALRRNVLALGGMLAIEPESGVCNMWHDETWWNLMKFWSVLVSFGQFMLVCCCSKVAWELHPQTNRQLRPSEWHKGLLGQSCFHLGSDLCFFYTCEVSLMKVWSELGIGWNRLISHRPS